MDTILGSWCANRGLAAVGLECNGREEGTATDSERADGWGTTELGGRRQGPHERLGDLEGTMGVGGGCRGRQRKSGGLWGPCGWGKGCWGSERVGAGLGG